jgi:shikimate 5-dehydrogenase
MFGITPDMISTVALAGAGGAATVAIWALRLEGRLNTHEASDLLVHTHIKETLNEIKVTATIMDSKIDRILNRDWS